MTDREPREQPRVLMLLFTSLLFDGRVQREALALREEGYRVAIAHVPDARSESTLADADAAWTDCRARLRGIDVVDVRLFTKRLSWLPHLLRRTMQSIEIAARFGWIALARRWDIVHSHELMPAAFGLAARLLRGSRLVYDAHELEVAEGDEQRKPLRLAYERLTLRFAASVITVNDPIAGLLARRSGRNVTVIANRPLPVPRESLRRGDIRRALKLPDGHKLVVYAGNVTPWARGIEVVVQAMSVLPPTFHFALIAVGRVAEFRSHLHDALAEHESALSQVTFLPAVPPDMVPVALSDGDVSVMLYRGDSMNEQLNSPNKLYQSILAEVPILASANSTFPAVVINGPFGPLGEVVDPLDPDAVARALQRLTDSRTAALIRNAAAQYAPSISWASSARELSATYQSLSPSLRKRPS